MCASSPDRAAAEVRVRNPWKIFGTFYFLECIFTIEFTFLLLFLKRVPCGIVLLVMVAVTADLFDFAEKAVGLGGGIGHYLAGTYPPVGR